MAGIYVATSFATTNNLMLMLPLSRRKGRVNERGLMRLRQIQMLQTRLAVLVALVAYQGVLVLRRTGRWHQSAAVLLILEHSRELGLLLWLEAPVVDEIGDWLLR